MYYTSYFDQDYISTQLEYRDNYLNMKPGASILSMTPDKSVTLARLPASVMSGAYMWTVHVHVEHYDDPPLNA